ncbi:MAG TPA: DNA primase [Acidimicrobiales bacterium]|jgi:DNA primase|nr:DNA primase [Acidimicrobiales bacterium]
MAIVDDDIERVRTATSIVDVVQQAVQLRRVGQNWVGLCPFHAERTPSFTVRESTGRYKCFGCNAGGDVFTFVQEVEHLDFAAAVEHLAAKAGIQLHYTSGGQRRDRQERQRLVEVMERAVEWYHARLLAAPDAAAARKYLRSRGFDGEVVRRFRLGWAPDGWDALASGLGAPDALLKRAGLAFENRAGRLQDAFRARVLFPIFSDGGEPVAFGGRVLPGSTDPAKYKNSAETSIYAKSKTLYGLNWAKAQIVQEDRVVVCEGYTDVIGFHRAGVPIAVATCGTALTADHVRLLRRFASRVVLAFDADAAGQGAAERFYEWEQQFDVRVAVARLPEGRDPADVAVSDPGRLRAMVDDALPFLGFRLQRTYAAPLRTPEDRAKVASQAMAVVNEHPDANVRVLYAGQIAQHTGLPEADLLRVARQRARRPEMRAPRAVPVPRENAEFVVLALLVDRWDEVAPWLVEALFASDVYVGAFRALGAAEGDVNAAIAAADPEVRELLERLAVADVDAEPLAELANLARAAARRQLDEIRAAGDLGRNEEYVEGRRLVEALAQPDGATLEALLGWLTRRLEERG